MKTDQTLCSKKENPRRKFKIPKPPIPYRNPGLGFQFSPTDNRLMALARISAKKFMETYGKGRDSYDIDHSHYFPGLKTEQWKQPQPTE